MNFSVKELFSTHGGIQDLFTFTTEIFNRNFILCATIRRYSRTRRFEIFFKKSTLKIFKKFMENHLHQSLFLIKLDTSFSLQLYLKN